MRTAFIETLVDLAAADQRIFLLVGDLGYSVVEPFSSRFPDRFINAGVAEQNMTGVATGLALSGKVAFTYSIANFNTLRCLEQLRNDVCYHDVNVNIVSVGSGLAYGALGATHHGTEDIAIMRSLPNMVVIAPGDPVESALATQAVTAWPGPCFLRLGKSGEAVVHRKAPDFRIGKAITVRQGGDVTLMATGSILHNALQAAEQLTELGIRARLLSLHTVKPLDREAVLLAARQTGALVTIEEHGIVGGLGSAVAEVLAEAALPVKFKRIGIDGSFCTRVGGQEYLRELYSLSVAGIVKQVESLLHKKTKESVLTYRVPFVDYARHYRGIEKETMAAIHEVVTNGDFILRGQLKSFEKNVADFIGVEYAVGVSSGTDALILSLKAAGIGPGDEVITVAHTFVATIASIVHCGAVPVLVDITDDYDMDISLVEDAISEKTRAVIPVHLNGRVCDMPRLMDICRKNDLVVIEDAAQALGATVDGQTAGTFGLASCYSFYPAKLLGGIGDGGLVATNDKSTAYRIRRLRDHGLNRTTRVITEYGFTNRLDNLQAAVLNVKLKYLPTWIERRRELAAVYQLGLSSLPQIKTPPPPGADARYYDVFQNYVMRAQKRDELVVYLKKYGIETLVSNPTPLHHQPALGLGCFHLPKTERFAREVISLPLNTELDNEQIEYVIDSIRGFYQGDEG